MIVCRQIESDHPHWSSLHKPAAFNPHARPLSPPPRMSSYYESQAPARRHQPQQQQQQHHRDWHNQYSYLPEGAPANVGAFSYPFTQNQRQGQADSDAAPRSPFQQRYDGSVGSRDGRPSASATYGTSSGPHVAQSMSLETIRRRSPSEETPIKEDDDELVDDEDMGEGEGEAAGAQPMTAAERMAAKRKMKRFRLTHQQTRFLMSEFAKQPHPDAAHRERLSREIPGLSSRQVQVWFQNRRAKIKRLTVDERERVIKMRAVPEGFDNVQALHAPYGAVHNLGANNPPMGTVDFCAPPSYSDHMIRPLVTDVRRTSDDPARITSAGLGPSFGGLGFGQSSSASLGTPELLSPLSASSAPISDRFASYGSHLSPSSAGPSPSITSRGTFSRQHGMESMGGGMQLHRPGNMRPLQPLQLSRSRSESMQSPLRTSSSWKSGPIDYASYSATASPQLGGRPGVYQGEQPTSAGSYDSSPYSSTQIGTSMAESHSSHLHASSTTGLPSIELNAQYRSTSSSATSPNPSTGHAHSYSAPNVPTSAPQYGSIDAVRQHSPPNTANPNPTTTTTTYAPSFPSWRQ